MVLGRRNLIDLMKRQKTKEDNGYMEVEGFKNPAAESSYLDVGPSVQKSTLPVAENIGYVQI
jgi:hypothetical protein